MEDLQKHIKHCRPKLSESSIKTYSNILRNLHSKVLSGNLNHDEFTTHQDKILTHLKEVSFNIRKTILSALVCITDGVVQNKYRDLMISDARKYNALQKKNIATDTQKANWISWDSVLEHLEDLKKKYYYIFKKKNPSKDELMNLQKFVLLSCYSLIPPRRCLDYCEMKCNNYNKGKDNFYENSKFHFRIYKTAKFLGVQIEKCPQTLSSIIRKWIPYTDEYMFSDVNGKKLNSNGITKILNSIFGKNISVNQLRHIFITEKMSPLIKELQETASNMGHSTDQQKLYVKDV